MCDLLAFPGLAELATTRPTFGWIVNAGLPGPSQEAYELLVMDASGSRVAWVSGPVSSAQSVGVSYEGRALKPGGSYRWRVRTWAARDGLPSLWSEEQCFRISPSAQTPVAEAVSHYPLQIEAVSPVLVRRIEGQGCFIDFGRQAFGWLELELECVAEASLLVRVGEACRGGAVDRNPPGNVRYKEVNLSVTPGRRIVRVETSPEAQNTGPKAIKLDDALGVVLPFRYVQIEGGAHAVTLVAATQKRVQYVFDDKAADFSSSSRELDRVWELCKYTVQATSYCGYYVDGDRERIPYEADAYINQCAHYALDREYSLARRTHEYLLKRPTWPTEWKQHSILIAWTDYEATGDDRLLRRHYETLKREKLLLIHAREDGLLETGHLSRGVPGGDDAGDIVDWPPVERDDYDFVEVNTVVNALHYRTLLIMARIAGVLGLDEDQAMYAAKAGRVHAAFNAHLFDEIAGAYMDGEGSAHSSLHANIFPLACGLVPAERSGRVVDFIKSRGITCSVYAVYYMLEGLFEAREADYAITLMAGRGLRSWQHMLERGATLTWEAWDESLKPNLDWNHAWATAPATMIARYVLGVRPLEVGYGQVLIDPQLGALNRIVGTVPTVRGPIKVKAWKEAGRVHCEAKVPANVRAEFGREVSAARLSIR
ncbi:alpha-L-rhamnosidase [Ruficoccus amylovorans]|uniref:alpha-L-rhamnosidase n=2 Tax=Ruficoccus amylovorans TaxID=1804625 RepID=A0A842HKJ4_9BACT|nr:alpha-L-rhamnosidase [Ruficoccus amylovorans]